MFSLRSSASHALGLRSTSSHDSLADGFEIVPPPLMRSSASNSSNSSFSSSSVMSRDSDDEENNTITANRTLAKKRGKRKSQEDLRFLAVATHMTELSYSISDIQTRIFEIQELRHKSQSSSDAAGDTNHIDQSLMSLDERLEAVAQGIKSVTETLEPLTSQTPTAVYCADSTSNEESGILRKYSALMAEWEASQTESETLRDELKEDKWLIVFRTVTEQAGGLMTSLEKGVNRCQDFINQVYLRRSEELHSRHSLRSEKSVPTLESYLSLQQSYEAKKKHYVPAITKVLSVLDKGVQDRVTKNGECLRRHAESTQRWRNLRDRITRTDDEMERARRILMSDDHTPSEAGSAASGTTSKSKNGYPVATPDGHTAGKTKSPSTLSRSISPFRKLARKLKGSPKAPLTPITPTVLKEGREPSSEHIRTLRHASSLLLRPNPSESPATPERQGHKYSYSLSPEVSTLVQTRKQGMDPTVKGRPKWNSSTKVHAESGTENTRRPSIPAAMSPSMSMTTSVSNSVESPNSRSLSRTSMVSSRPWSPVTSSAASTTQSSLFNRPPSRMRPGSRIGQMARPPSRNKMQTPAPMKLSPPRTRPKTPSQIPRPSTSLRAYFDDSDSASASSPVKRAFSPSSSIPGRETPGIPLTPAPRPPSRSMIPIPSLTFSSASRPSSAMSDYSESPGAMYRRAQTPEAALKLRAMQLPVYQDARATPRPSFHKLPPSSFRDGTISRVAVSRPGSRADQNPTGTEQNPHIYVPVHSKDPLDVEVANVVNSIPHGFLVERVDSPLKSVPKEGDEHRGQYAVSNSLARKVITCRLTTLTRLSVKGTSHETTTTKKVMCRVGGGWQDLQLYILNRQVGV